MVMDKKKSSSKISPPATPVYNSTPSTNISKLPVSNKKEKKPVSTKNARGSPKMSRKVEKKTSTKELSVKIPKKEERSHFVKELRGSKLHSI